MAGWISGGGFGISLYVLNRLISKHGSSCVKMCSKIFVGFYGRVRRLQIKKSYAQSIQEHATGDGSHIVTTRHAVPCSGRTVEPARSRSRLTYPESSSLPVSHVSDRIRQTGSPERRKCTASNSIRPCRRNIVRRSARSDHTTGGEWRWLVETHAKP